MKKYRVILFQSYLRQFVLNFGRHSKALVFEKVASGQTGRTTYTALPELEQEFKRNKLTWNNRLRRLLGIPNVRFWLKDQGDALFTYGCLIITRKPYCTYLETGLTLYNYDRGIANNPIARFVVGLLATRPNCLGLIFLSQASYKSFFASVRYPAKTKQKLLAKSRIIHPIPIEKPNDIKPRAFKGTIKLLFVGMFYIKGGLEVAHAYEQLSKKHRNVSLTIVTTLRLIRPEDVAYLQSLPGLNLVEAKLNAQEMSNLYKEHDIFVLPTMREGYGLVLIEAIAYGLPVIITDQFATAEMAVDKENGFVFYNHPLQDYNPETYEIYGRYYNARDLYRALFEKQLAGQMQAMENFLVQAVEKYLDKPALLNEHSRASLKLYEEKFNPETLGRQLEEVFLKGITAAPNQQNP